MKIVNKPSQIVFYDKKVTRSISIKRNLPLITWVVLMLVLAVLSSLEIISLDGTIGIVFVIVFIPSLLASDFVGEAFRISVFNKYRERFFNDLSSADFNCDEVFDSGLSAYTNDTTGYRCGDPAVIAVDYKEKRIAVMLYYNPEETYIIPSKLIHKVRSSTEPEDLFNTGKYYAEFELRVYNTPIRVPTRVVAVSKAIKAIDSCKREDYELGKARKKTREAVEKADDFAKVLKSLTAFN